MSAPVVLIPRGDGFEVVRNDHWVCDPESLSPLLAGRTGWIENDEYLCFFNKLTNKAERYRIGVPLCNGCDEPLPADGICHDCGLIHSDIAERDLSLVEVLRHDPNGVWL